MVKRRHNTISDSEIVTIVDRKRQEKVRSKHRLRQKRGVTAMIKRQLRGRAAVEPVIGHLKAEHRMGRNYLWYRQGDAANAILAAVGYNFRRLIRWLRLLLGQILVGLMATLQPAPA
jgi:transposase, IS5 family